MKLYHGTNGRWLDNILTRGIEPRGRRTARNNWKHVPHQSNPTCVYLTDSYAPYFAFNATRGKDPLCAVIEVETDRLNEEDLYPDEDFLEQVGRGADDVPGTMSERTLHYRARQFDYNPEAAKLSLKHLGTCAHRGVITLDAITRAVVWPHEPNIRLALTWDPTITLANQRYCGDRYRTLTAKLFAGAFDEPQEEGWRDEWPLPPIHGWHLIDSTQAESA